jgi:hypothetical protein
MRKGRRETLSRTGTALKRKRQANEKDSPPIGGISMGRNQ